VFRIFVLFHFLVAWLFAWFSIVFLITPPESAASIASWNDVSGYAFARVGYHRGLDQLRRAGWKGAGRKKTKQE